MSFQLSSWRRFRCNFLWLSRLQVPLIIAASTAFTMPQRLDHGEIKVVFLRCTSGEVGATPALAPRIRPLGLSPKKADDITNETSGWKGLSTVKLTVQNRQAHTEVVPLSLPWPSKPSKNCQETEAKKQTKNHYAQWKYHFLWDCRQHCPRYGTDLYLENFLKPLRRSWGPPSWLNAMLMVATLIPHIIGINSGAVECPASYYKGNYFN